LKEFSPDAAPAETEVENSGVTDMFGGGATETPNPFASEDDTFLEF
jgi:hypothetical protein